jgi:hypothetical protein
MGVSMNVVGASDPIDVFDAAEIDEEYGCDEPTKPGIYALSARDSHDGTGVAIHGTPTELFEWLLRASNELLRRIGADRAEAGTATACGVCGAAAGRECSTLFCEGRLNPSGEADSEADDLDAVLRFEDAEEQAGRLPADERRTCHTCRTWEADGHANTFEHWGRIERAAREA